MAEVKKAVAKERVIRERSILFTRDNYMWMAIGAVIIIIGMYLMSGGKNQDPNAFDDNVVYSTTRITIAPIVILLGFVVEIYAIFKKPAVSK
jgi:hypothetical protein